MGLIFIRTSLIFATLLLIMRLMGKRQIGEMQPFELVITLLIAELACIPMADTSIPLLYGIVSIVTIYFLHQIVLAVDLYLPKLKCVISGKPSVVLTRDGINEFELKKNSMDVSDLMESLRGAGYFSLSDVEYGMYEANGKFSALPFKSEQNKDKGLSLLIVDCGKYNKKNVEFSGMGLSFFEKILKDNGVEDVKKVLCMTVSSTGEVFFQARGKKKNVFNIQLGKEAVW